MSVKEVEELIVVGDAGLYAVPVLTVGAVPTVTLTEDWSANITAFSESEATVREPDPPEITSDTAMSPLSSDRPIYNFAPDGDTVTE